VSLPATMPSPHVGAQVLGSPLQCQPGSTVQSGLHPSPGRLPPSSHPSVGSTSASPHSGGSAQLWFESSPSSKKSQSRWRPSTSFRRLHSWHLRRESTHDASPADVVALQPGNAAARSTPWPTQLESTRFCVPATHVLMILPPVGSG